jgi:ferredoxin
LNRTPARISQLVFLLIFLILFVTTEYRGEDEISAAVNSFFRADPLVLTTYLLAARTFTLLLLPALLILVLTMIFGRFFCGWLCPLGTILDLVTGRIAKGKAPSWLTGSLKYLILFVLLGAALAGLNLAGIFDPLALLLRALTFFAHPIMGDAARSGWVGLYRIMGDSRDHLAPGYSLLRDYLLPFRESSYPLAITSALLLLGIILLERYGSRSWCRYLCPLGTLLGLAARFSPIRRTPARVCGDCGLCGKVCPTLDDDAMPGGEECLRCFACDRVCSSGRVRFRFTNPLRLGERPYLPARRLLLGGIAGGLLFARGLRWKSAQARERLLRPPGVRDEEQFLAKCVRCGECMKVCLRSALYPAAFQAGIEGLYTPLLVPRLGYCEYHCTLCGQVCPTGAIPDLPKGEKERQVMGKAVLDKNQCIPFARKSNCMVCEEHCPIPQKAIRSRTVETMDLNGRNVSIMEPYVVEELCNGCGICEHVCPLEGKSGIEVFGVKDKNPIAVAAVEKPAVKGKVDDDPYR